MTVRPAVALSLAALSCAVSCTTPRAPELTDLPLDERCVREVQELHDFFAAWFRGELPHTAAGFERFLAAMDPEFTIVAPTGAQTALPALGESLRAAHGSHAAGFRIEVRDPQVRLFGPQLALVSYEEWHHEAGRSAGRRSSAVMRSQTGAPNHVVWLHVHETGLTVDPTLR